MANGGGTLTTVEEWERSEGSPSPLGATWIDPEQAWNFSVFSRHASGMALLLYGADVHHALLELPLDPVRNKSGRIWHCFVKKAAVPGARYYAWRAAGPFNPATGDRFDAQKVLLDPNASAVYFPETFSRDAAGASGSNEGRAPLGVLPGPTPLSGPEQPSPRHSHDAIIYELHVKGFTAHPTSGVTPSHRGTFLGLIEKIPYLKDLGVTVVELLPVHQFDPQEGNYWGYMTLNFFAPHRGYAVSDPIAEFRQMVKAFHEAGIEVWLDVVYNHTAEGGAAGPTYSLRGLDNSSYYLVQPDGSYLNDSGCGNTTRCAHPAVRALVLRSLRYWAGEMSVDGFRFDLASVFARNSRGDVDMEEPAMVHEIGALGSLLDVRLIAEAWDIGAYLLGRSFPGLSWRQWNGQFRDDLRAFVKGDPGKVGALMTRLYGSDDLFPDRPGDVYHPYQSINFITAHDGFCLYDLVAYNHKHNEANGHGNTDGAGDNLSWNCGWEGDHGAPAEVLALRRRQVKNFFTLLMLANGTPMFCAGDEFLNTQFGNNNPYNQDNEITWLDWNHLEQNRDIFRFFQKMIGFRKQRRSLGRSRYWREDVAWYGVSGGVDHSFESRCLAWRLRGENFRESDIYVMINGHWQPLVFEVQEGQANEWRRIVDTSRPSPDDIVDAEAAEPLSSAQYALSPRSVVVLTRSA
ncbi:MAG: glycogen-debranching protein [Bryobacterales bacterium]|nr:glycogen-debranching protein [Bryobacterales bacterium]